MNVEWTHKKGLMTFTEITKFYLYRALYTCQTLMAYQKAKADILALADI